MNHRDGSGDLRGDFRAIGVLVLVALPLLAGAGGLKTLWDNHEARLALGAAEMARSGDYLTPTNGGVPVPFYPPLGYWVLLLAARLFGGFGEFILRLPSALAGLACVLGTYRLGARAFGRGTGLVAGFLLLSVAGFTCKVVSCQPDALLLFFMFSALALFAEYLEAPRLFLLYAMYAAMGLACLAKGPQGILLPSLVIGLWWIRRRSWRTLGDLRPFTGVLLLAAILALWIGPAFAADRGVWLRTHLRENLDMFAGGGLAKHLAGSHYYVVRIAAFAFPWTLFFLPAFRGGRKAEPGREAGQVEFLWIWALVFFVFYSLAAGKRDYYLLPVYPPLAILLARDGLTSPSPATLGAGRGTAAVLLVLAAAGEIVAPFVPDDVLAKNGIARAEALLIAHLSAVAAVAISACLLAARPRRKLPILIGTTLAGLVFYLTVLIPVRDREGVRGRDFCGRARSAAGMEGEVALVGVSNEVIFYVGAPNRSVGTVAELLAAGEGGLPVFLAAPEAVFRREPDLQRRYRILFRGDLERDNLVFCRKL